MPPTKKEPKLSEIKEQIAKMATKQELVDGLAKMATKQELVDGLAKMATKHELADFRKESEKFFGAIKEDSDNTATKQDIFEVKEEIKSVKEELKSEIQKKFDDILTGQDKIVTMLSKKDSYETANLSAHKRFDNRITTLEHKAGMVV